MPDKNNNIVQIIYANEHILIGTQVSFTTKQNVQIIYHGQLLYPGTYHNPTDHTLEITDPGIEYYPSNYLLGSDLGRNQLSE